MTPAIRKFAHKQTQRERERERETHTHTQERWRETDHDEDEWKRQEEKDHVSKAANEALIENRTGKPVCMKSKSRPQPCPIRLRSSAFALMPQPTPSLSFSPTLTPCIFPSLASHYRLYLQEVRIRRHLSSGGWRPRALWWTLHCAITAPHGKLGPNQLSVYFWLHTCKKY